MLEQLQKILAGRNPFKKLTEAEKEEHKKIEQRIKLDIMEFSRIAKELFLDQRYQKFTAEFKKIYERNIGYLIYEDEEDIYKFALKMKSYQNRLRILMNIVDIPKDFVKRQEEIEKEKK